MDKTTHHIRVERLMGNRFEFCIVHENKAEAQHLLENAVNEVARIEQLLSTYIKDSDTNRINASAGKKWTAVSEETYNLLQRSIKISKLTDGAFDITYGGLDLKLWNFDTSMGKLPDASLAQKLVRKIDYKKVLFNSNNEVKLAEEGMRIGFGGIGKGYAADCAKALMIKSNVKAGYINASGDLATWGFQANGKDWTIGITDPSDKNSIVGLLNISNLAIATSGDYEKFVIIDGKKYAHTIDPKTGLPVHGLKSVSIVCASAELADAMATPVMVMGAANGLSLINQIKGIECLIVDEQNRIFKSENIKILKS